MDVEIVRAQDQARHQFEWVAFRPIQIVLGGERQETLELPSGFMLLTSAPKRYNIVFQDRAVAEQTRGHLDNLRREWGKQLGTVMSRDLVTRAAQGERQAGDEVHRSRRDYYESTFKNLPVATDAWSDLQRLSYWEEGSYHITIRAATSNPDRQFERSWKFKLTKSDADLLRLNTVTIIEQALSLPTQFQFSYAYPRYET